MSASERMVRDLEGTIEHRNFSARELEVRESGDGYLFEGFASTFEPYMVGEDFEEEFMPGAWRRMLGEGPDTQLLVNHTGLPLARTKSGTLTLTEQAGGLHSRAHLEREDPDVQAVVPKLRRGDMNEMSVGFRATQQEWNKARTKRQIFAATTHRGDVSIVTLGANEGTSTSLRSRRERDRSQIVVPRSYIEKARADKARAERGAV